MSHEHRIEGTLVRGADGKLYFIPHHELHRFAVPHNHVHEVEEAIEGEVPEELRGAHFSRADLHPVAHVSTPSAVAGIFILPPPESE